MGVTGINTEEAHGINTPCFDVKNVVPNLKIQTGCYEGINAVPVVRI